MSFFGPKYILGGLTPDVKQVLQALADAVSDRLQGHDKEIAELRTEIEKLKREPRQSFAQKLKAKS
jgi:hypothetical protein